MFTDAAILSQLTIILALKDRSDDTAVFISLSLRPDVKYLILDGSQGDENQEMFATHVSENIRYVRCAPDLSIDDYVSKMATGLEVVDTPYALMVDNDDHFFPDGLVAAIQSLQSEPSCIFAGGDLLGFMRSERHQNWVTWPKRNSHPGGLHLMQGLEAINQNRMDFRGLWYSVFRTESLSWCWNEILKSRIRDPYLIEFMLTDLAFCCGRYFYTGVPLYLRLQNQTNRAIATLGYKSVEHGRQSNSWWHESGHGDAILTGLLKVDSTQLETQFFRAAAVAGLQRPYLNPKKIIPRLLVNLSDRVRWLPIKVALRLAATGSYRFIPLKDVNGIA